ncbi:pilus assembly protein PilZ [Alteromonas sp. ASW11-36]|uniref:Pilus assembly protein PilZ n=1 Tax=Alteromonas arenosi TaxID=3055817 RepID=A0ABT7SW16_9ALTE|nr:PilX N-terminal domain-containing pilus assembly protein [Alteromonas sp. ASW11-36]MDM7859742.1 pilus assembly protein PilZ [Alteromonas sp. ASW11-36]
MKQRGLVMVFALLILLSLTVLGVASVSSGLMQNKMATSMEQSSLAFDAAEAAIAGVVFESEDETLLTNPNLSDPLSDARQGNIFDPTADTLSCFDVNGWTNRTMTQAGLTVGQNHNNAGSYDNNPPVNSWSRTAFMREQPCRGSSNVIGGSNINCHVFVVRGCGQVSGKSYVVANSLTAAVFAPASQ